MSDLKLGFGYSKCIHEVHNIGTTTYVNICDGSRMVVEWGWGDWAVSILVTTLVLVGVTIIGIAIFRLLMSP